MANFRNGWADWGVRWLESSSRGGSPGAFSTAAAPLGRVATAPPHKNNRVGNAVPSSEDSDIPTPMQCATGEAYRPKQEGGTRTMRVCGRGATQGASKARTAPRQIPHRVVRDKKHSRGCREAWGIRFCRRRAFGQRVGKATRTWARSGALLARNAWASVVVVPRASVLSPSQQRRTP